MVAGFSRVEAFGALIHVTACRQQGLDLSTPVKVKVKEVVWRPEPHYNPWNPNDNLNRSLIKSLNKPTKTLNMPLNMPLNISLHHSLINISQHLSTKNPATTDLSTYHLSTYHQGCREVVGLVVNLESTALPLNPPGNTCPLRAFTSISAATWVLRSTKTVHPSVPTLTLLGLQILISPMSACTSPWFLKSSTNWTFVAVKDTLRININLSQPSPSTCFFECNLHHTLLEENRSIHAWITLNNNGAASEKLFEDWSRTPALSQWTFSSPTFGTVSWDL